MTDCGHLSSARALPREAIEVRGVSLAAELAVWRARSDFTPETLVYLLGVGPETCERIESGEIVPEQELAERIFRVIHANSDATAHGDASVSPAAARAGNEGGAALSPLLLGAAPLAVVADDYGPPVPIPPPSPALAKDDDGRFHVEMFLGPVLLDMEVDEADRLAAELAALVALTRDPRLYDDQPRLARPSTEES